MATLIYYNESAHKAAQREATDVAARFTEALKLYQALNLTPAVTADLPALVADPVEWVLSKYAGGQNFQMFGLTLDPKRVLDMMGDFRPAGFDEFIRAVGWLREDLGIEVVSYEYKKYNPAKEAARQLDPRPPYPGWTSWLVKQVTHYVVIGGWEVRVAKEAAEKMEASFKSYATTPKQEQLLATLKKVSTAINETPGLSLKVLADALDGHQYGGNELRPNPDFILKYN